MLIDLGGHVPRPTPRGQPPVLLIPTVSPLATVLAMVPKSIGGLPLPGTPAFERMIATTTATARRRALPDQREHVSPEQQAERDLADRAIGDGSDRLDAIERAMEARRKAGEASR